MDLGTIAVIVTSAVSIISTVLGVNYKQGKDKVTTLLNDVVNAVQDDKITEEECQKIAADARAFLEG